MEWLKETFFFTRASLRYIENEWFYWLLVQRFYLQFHIGSTRWVTVALQLRSNYGRHGGGLQLLDIAEWFQTPFRQTSPSPSLDAAQTFQTQSNSAKPDEINTINYINIFQPWMKFPYAWFSSKFIEIAKWHEVRRICHSFESRPFLLGTTRDGFPLSCEIGFLDWLLGWGHSRTETQTINLLGTF